MVSDFLLSAENEIVDDGALIPLIDCNSDLFYYSLPTPVPEVRCEEFRGFKELISKSFQTFWKLYKDGEEEFLLNSPLTTLTCGLPRVV